MTLDNAVDNLIALTPRIIDVIDRLSTNADFKAVMAKRESLSTSAFVLRLCPILLTAENRSDIYAILAVITGLSVKEVGNLPVSDVIHRINEAFKDEDFRLFAVSLFVNGFAEGV